MMIIDMHIHLKYRSRCSNLSIQDLYNNLSDKFDGVCITDHWKLDSIQNNLFQKKLLLIGVEISCQLGDILAYGMTLGFLPNKHLTAEKVITTIHRQGGVAVCAHPFTDRHQGFENYVFDYDFDAIEINGALSEEFHKKAEFVAYEMDIPLIGGSDAHSITQLNTVGTKFDVPITSIKDIIKAIKNKECSPIIIR